MSNSSRTGQRFETLHIHPLSYLGTTACLHKLLSKIVISNRRVDDLSSDEFNVVIQFCTTYIQNYILYTHYDLYKRVGFNLYGWTREKGKRLYQIEVPQLLLTFARHLATPRILFDGSVSIPTFHLDDDTSTKYGMVRTDFYIRPAVQLGRPDMLLRSVQLPHGRMKFFPNSVPLIHRMFENWKTVRLTKPEGLFPVRCTFWVSHLSSYIRYLDVSVPEQNRVWLLDSILSPLIIDFTEEEKADVNSCPGSIQWMGVEHLHSDTTAVGRDELYAYLATGFKCNSIYDCEYACGLFIESLPIDPSQHVFPCGTCTDVITDIKWYYGLHTLSTSGKPKAKKIGNPFAAISLPNG